MRFVVTALFCGGVLATVGCGDRRGVPTGPSATAAVVDASLSASPRSGALQVKKECSEFASSAFCTITSSNVKAIEVGSRVIYLQPAQVGTPSGSDVVLDPPGPGNNKAFGHCSLALGVCTFSGGTGKFTEFKASVNVSYLGGYNFSWAGTYSFDPGD
jgi:hypothetical protein